MNWKRQIAKLRALFARRKPTDDLEEEIRSHLRMEEQENLESGMSPEEAHYAALRRFGNATLAEERSREMWGWHSVETLWQDLRYGWRMLRKNPGFTAVAIVTLALGIGANTAIFSLIDALMLRSLPVEKPAQLVQPLRRGFGGTWSRFSYPDFEQFRDRSHLLSGIAAVFWLSETLLDARLDGQPENISGQLVSGNFFSLLGVHPAVGRLIGPDDDRVGRGTPVAVLSYAYWKQHFNGSTSALGARVVLHRAPFTIIGVAPANFGYRTSACAVGRSLHSDAPRRSAV
jgi:hypothetical protein